MEHLAPIDSTQTDMIGLEKKFADRVRKEVADVAILEKRFHGDTLTVIYFFVMRRAQHAIRSVNASSGRGADSVC